MVLILGPNRKSRKWEEKHQCDQGGSETLIVPQRCGLTPPSCGSLPALLPGLAHAGHARQKSSEFNARGPRKRTGGLLGDNDETAILKALTPRSGAGLSDTLPDRSLIRFAWTLAPPLTSTG